MRKPVFIFGIAAIMCLSAANSAMADTPTSQSNEMDGYSAALPSMTTAQRATYDKKLSQLAELQRTSRMQSASSMLAATATSSGYLATWARPQINSYYCGPTAVQVVADFAWGMSQGHSRFTQNQISSNWTHTDATGTSATNEAVGANGVLVGSPKSTFLYVIHKPADGYDWSYTIAVDVAYWQMPQILNLVPWWQASGTNWYFLTDWADHRSTGGHYIVADGFYATWDGTRGPTVRFDDGAGAYGGGTGKFTDPQFDVYQLISHHYNITIW
jgi:hypothetical protein